VLDGNAFPSELALAQDPNFQGYQQDVNYRRSWGTWAIIKQSDVEGDNAGFPQLGEPDNAQIQNGASTDVWTNMREAANANKEIGLDPFGDFFERCCLTLCKACQGYGHSHHKARGRGKPPKNSKGRGRRGGKQYLFSGTGGGSTHSWKQDLADGCGVLHTGRHYLLSKLPQKLAGAATKLWSKFCDSFLATTAADSP
jgi:hypothetical protein